MLKAVQHIRRVRGGSQAQIMQADDGNFYVVKFQGNPQDTRVLANEYLACRLARMLGLNVPEPVIIEVDERTISEQGIVFALAGHNVSPRPGRQFGSRLVMADQTFDFLPPSMILRIRSIRDFAGILAFDKWTGQADGRQVVFHKTASQRQYRATFIDFGYCFNAAEWSFPDSPLRGVYARNDVYSHIQSWGDFEPWLSRIEHILFDTLVTAAEEMPAEWYGGDPAELESLLYKLHIRRRSVRRLIEDFKNSVRNPFPNWTGGTAHIPPTATEGPQLSLDLLV